MTTLEKIRATLKQDLENAKKDYYELGEEFDNGYVCGLEIAFKIIDKYAEQEDKDYQRGLEQAWECGKRIASETSVVLSKIFGEVYPSAVFQQYSPQESMRKIKEYEERQTEKSCENCIGKSRYVDGMDLCEDCENCSNFKPKQMVGERTVSKCHTV